MARPGAYKFEKRKKELARQKKKEEKRLKKQQKSDEPQGDAEITASEAPAEDTGEKEE